MITIVTLHPAVAEEEQELDTSILAEMTIHNDMNWTIEYLFFTPADSEFVGVDILSRQYTLSPGEYVPYLVTPGTYRFLAVDNDTDRWTATVDVTGDGDLYLSDTEVVVSNETFPLNFNTFTVEVLSTSPVDYLFMTPSDSVLWGVDILGSKWQLVKGDKQDFLAYEEVYIVNYDILVVHEDGAQQLMSTDDEMDRTLVISDPPDNGTSGGDDDQMDNGTDTGDNQTDDGNGTGSGTGDNASTDGDDEMSDDDSSGGDGSDDGTDSGDEDEGDTGDETADGDATGDDDTGKDDDADGTSAGDDEDDGTSSDGDDDMGDSTGSDDSEGDLPTSTGGSDTDDGDQGVNEGGTVSDGTNTDGNLYPGTDTTPDQSSGDDDEGISTALVLALVLTVVMIVVVVLLVMTRGKKLPRTPPEPSGDHAHTQRPMHPHPHMQHQQGPNQQWSKPQSVNYRRPQGQSFAVAQGQTYGGTQGRAQPYNPRDHPGHHDPRPGQGYGVQHGQRSAPGQGVQYDMAAGRTGHTGQASQMDGYAPHQVRVDPYRR